MLLSILLLALGIDMYIILIIYIVILIAYFLLKENDEPACYGFENNNYYFQGNENDSMYVGQLIQPRLIHKINIGPEW